MSRSPKDIAASPLAPDDYLVPSTRLPRATAPVWMRNILIAVTVVSTLAGLGVALGPMEETVPLTGDIRPARYAYAGPAAEGTLETISVREGDPVAEGTLLATLDDWAVVRELEELDAELAQAKADRQRAEAAARQTAIVPVPGEFIFSAREVEKQRDLLTLQNEHLDRIEKLGAQGSISQVDIMTLRMQILNSEAQLARHERAAALASGEYGRSAIAQAEAALASAAARVASLETRRRGLESERARLEIRSPIAGIVSSKALVYPGLAVQPGQALFKIAEPDGVALRLEAGEDRISELRTGQLVRFRPRSNPDRLAPFATARISRVTPERELLPADPSLRSDGAYLIDADHLQAPYPLPAGSTVDAEVVLSTKPFFRRWFQKPGPPR